MAAEGSSSAVGPALRKGIWSSAEQQYAAYIIARFAEGDLPNYPEGASLRVLLASPLNCNLMRISSAYRHENGVGHAVYCHERDPSAPRERERERREQAFHGLVGAANFRGSLCRTSKLSTPLATAVCKRSKPPKEVLAVALSANVALTLIEGGALQRRQDEAERFEICDAAILTGAREQRLGDAPMQPGLEHIHERRRALARARDSRRAHLQLGAHGPLPLQLSARIESDTRGRRHAAVAPLGVFHGNGLLRGELWSRDLAKQAAPKEKDEDDSENEDENGGRNQKRIGAAAAKFDKGRKWAPAAHGYPVAV